MHGLVAIEFDCATKSFLDAQGYWMGTGKIWCVLLDYFLVFVFEVGLIYGGTKYGYGVSVGFYSANMNGGVNCP